jgi:hypothetical protein
MRLIALSSILKIKIPTSVFKTPPSPPDREVPPTTTLEITMLSGKL